MLHEIAKDLGIARNLPATLNLITKSAVDALNVKAASIRLLSEDGKTLRLVGAYGLSNEYLNKGPVDLNGSLVDKEAMAGEPVVVKDIEEDSRLQYPEEMRKEGIKSLICVPLKVQDRVIGSLRTYTSVQHEFNKAEIIFLTALANLGAIAIENSRLNEALKTRIEMMKELLNISKSITSSLDRQEVFKRIVKSAVDNLQAKGGSLRLIDQKEKKLELVSSIGLSEQYLAKKVIPVAEEIQSVIKGEVAAISDATTDERISRRGDIRREGLKSILAAPITVKGKVIGVLKIYNEQSKIFGEDEIEFIKILASLGGVAIENSRLYRLALANWETLVKDVWGKLDVWGPEGVSSPAT
ncbi:MAG: GAF domain-containing protein [Candidatus Bathyarchaeia archaeon]